MLHRWQHTSDELALYPMTALFGSGHELTSLRYQSPTRALRRRPGSFDVARRYRRNIFFDVRLGVVVENYREGKGVIRLVRISDAVVGKHVPSLTLRKLLKPSFEIGRDGPVHGFEQVDQFEHATLTS